MTTRNLGLFPSERLFDRIGRSVCRAGSLPKKELYESWEVARRVRRRMRGGRVVDLAAGHGLLAHIMLILDDTSPSAVAVDRRIPQSAHGVASVLSEDWPRLAQRVAYVQTKVEDFPIEAGDLLISAHACGTLTDTVLTLAIEHRARVAVLPCCQSLAKCDRGGVDGWVDGPLAVDLTRAARLRNAGYRVWTQTIPPEITAKNRLLMAMPSSPQ